MAKRSGVNDKGRLDRSQKRYLKTKKEEVRSE
jgi:hypothetical protein